MKHKPGRVLLIVCICFIAAQIKAQNVGIGTNNPTQKLDVNGNVRVRSLGNPGAMNQLLRADSIGNLTIATPTTLPLAAQQSPFDPVLQGTATATGGPSWVAANGTTAYVVSQTGNTLQVFDCSNPTAPVLQGSIGTGTTPLCVAANGSTVYVVNNGSNTLQIFDCNNPAAPVLRSSIATATGPVSIAANGSMVYIACLNGNSFQVFDCANPAAPVLMATIATATQPRTVAVSGTTAYLVCFGASLLQVFNCNNPVAPVLTGSVATAASPRGIAVNGTTAYVVNASNNLQVFDCSNAAAPLLKGAVVTGSGSAQCVAVNGTNVFVISQSLNQLQVFDCSNPSFPTQIGSANTGANPRSVALSSNTAFVVNNSGQSLQAFRVFAPKVLLAQGEDGSLFNVPLTWLSDNLGNHRASMPLNLSTYRLVGNDGIAGLDISNNGTINASGNINLTTNKLVGGGGTSGLTISATGTVTTDGNFNLGINKLVGSGGTSGISIANNGVVSTDGNFNLGSNQLVGGGGTSGMSISATGRVGIGTTAPNAPLQFSNFGFGRKMVLWEGANNDHQVFGLGIYPFELRYQIPSAADAHIFYSGFDAVSSVELMRISGNGFVGIGTWPAAPTATLHINGNQKIEGVNTLEFGSGIAGKDIHAGKIGYQTFTANTLDIVGAGALANFRRIKLWAEGGAVVNGPVFAPAFTISSDARFKRGVQPITNPVNLLLQLKGVSYYFDKTRFPANGFPDGLQYGFLAQEVEKVLPSVVHTDEKGYKSVNYIEIIPLLTETVKEQQQQLEKQTVENRLLAERLRLLEAQFAELKKQLTK